MFSQTLLDHFQNPRNAGELTNATAQVELSNPVCGDVLRLAVRTENDVVREVRFLCRGCTASIACASLLTEKMSGQPVAHLRGITVEAIVEGLDGLPEASMHAAHLAQEALSALLNKLRK